MSFGDAILRALGVGRAPDADREALRRQMADLEREHGSAKAAAAAAGVTRSTWWRWKAGKQAPRRGTARRARMVQRDRVVPDSRQRQAAKATRPGRFGGGVRVAGTFTVSADTRYRSVLIDSPGGRQHARLSYVAAMAGDDETADAEMREALSDAFGVEVDVSDPVITWE